MTTPICKASTVSAPEDYCGAPATVPVVVACVHEHVNASAACPDCAPELSDHYCADCFRADGHKCRLVVLGGVS